MNEKRVNLNEGTKR